MASRAQRLGFGASALGGLFAEVDNETARATVDRAWDLGVRSFDTAPLYGSGLSEQRLGAALRDRPRDEFILSTKVGRLLRPGKPDPSFVGAAPLAPVFDYTRDGVLHSLEESLERLGLDHVDLALVHDPEVNIEAGLDALHALRGVVPRVGVGTNFVETAITFIERGGVDAVLIAGRLTLLDRSAEEHLLGLAQARGVELIVGGVYNSGILAGGTMFDYADAPAAVAARVRELDRACTRYGVPLAAAAIQFPLQHDATSRIVVGARTPAEVTRNGELLAVDVPTALWDELRSFADVRVRRPKTH
ncbi:MAG: aldo/keto reductase [Gaiellaceae bacterium]